MARASSLREEIAALRPNGEPEEQTTTVTYSSGSFTTTVMKPAAEGSGMVPSNTGKVRQYYFKEDQMVVLDLQYDRSENEEV